MNQKDVRETEVIQIQEREVRAIEDRSLPADVVLHEQDEADKAEDKQRSGLFIP